MLPFGVEDSCGEVALECGEVTLECGEVDTFGSVKVSEGGCEPLEVGEVKERLEESSRRSIGIRDF